MKQYSFKINGKQYDVTVGPADGKHIQVNVNGADYSVEMESADGPSASEPVQAAPATAAPAAPETAAPAAASGQVVPTPMPGVIIEVSVREGQAVKAGEKVAVLEAMKMENEIASPKDGTVTAVHVDKGASVGEGDPIVTIA
jgi:biotin carboxyl carrier protein